jgi:predicted permease
MRLLADVRYACRRIANSPGFALIAILSVALGVGFNAAGFSYVDSLLLRPLPVPSPDRIVEVASTAPGTALGLMSYPDYADLRDYTQTLSSVVCYSFWPMGLSASKDGNTQTTLGVLASGNFFPGLGIEIPLGRAFRPDEDTTPGRDLVAVISHSLWERMFARDPNIAGRKVWVNGAEFTVVGVAPENFSGPQSYILPDVYVPMNSFSQAVPNARPDFLKARGYRSLTVFGRLKPGVNVKQTQSELAITAQRLAAQYPETNRERGVAVMSYQAARFQRNVIDAQMALMMMGITGLVLLIACANVANLVLGRGAARAKEIAVRMAIGGSRSDLVRQLFTESMVLAILGGIAGLAVAYAAIRMLQSLPLPSDYPVSIGVRMDSRLLVFSFLAAVATGVMFGLLPALRSTSGDLVKAMKSGDQGPPRRVFHGRFAPRNLLVVAQLTFSTVLLILSAFFVRGFDMSRTLSPGFRVDHMLFFSVDTSLVRYDAPRARDFFRKLEDRLREQPGIRDVSISWTLPYDTATQQHRRLVLDGYQVKPGEEYPAAWQNLVDEHFFTVMETPLVRGRNFDARDTANSPRVAVVNETLAVRMWPGKDAIGQRIRLDRADGPEVQVVGVAKAAKYLYWAESPQMALWLPYSQEFSSHLVVELRTAGDPAQMAQVAREQVRSLDPDMPIARMSTMDAFYHDRFLLGPRLLAQMVTAVGIIGLLLAVIGLYGVVAYSVSRRTREIGIRMAIGARPVKVLRMILSEGLAFTAVGVSVGVAIAVAAGGYMQSFAVGASPRDPLTIAGVCAILAMVMIAACWAPAWRASRLDPTRALRQE